MTMVAGTRTKSLSMCSQMTLRILAIEPYYGGSHQAFLDGWIANSVHTWDTITLPPHSWKWRMRHAAIHAASQIKQLRTTGNKWDIVFCSDMLNLAELKRDYNRGYFLK